MVSFLCCFLLYVKTCTCDFFYLCHEIAIIWLLWTFAFDDLVACCHYRMNCIKYETIQQQPKRSLSSEFELVLTNWSQNRGLELRQYSSSLRDLFHQNLSLCWPTGRKTEVWNSVWIKLYSITILRSVLCGEIIWRVCNVYHNKSYALLKTRLHFVRFPFPFSSQPAQVASCASQNWSSERLSYVTNNTLIWCNYPWQWLVH